MNHKAQHQNFIQMVANVHNPTQEPTQETKGIKVVLYPWFDPSPQISHRRRQCQVSSFVVVHI